MPEQTKPKFAEKISSDTINKLGVSALSDTPNRAGYGNPGLSSTDLKARFDQLVIKAIERINSILGVLEGDELSAKIDIKDLGDITTLQDLASSVTNGKLYDAIIAGDEGQLSAVISSIKEALSTINISLNGAVERIDSLSSAKLDMVTSESTGKYRAYVVDRFGTQETLNLDDNFSMDANDIVKRDLTGSIVVPYPELPQNAVNREFVEDKISNALSSVYKYKGTVYSYDELLVIEKAKVGDVYNVMSAYKDYPAGTNFAWDGEKWDALGGELNELLARVKDVEDKISYDHVITAAEDFTQEKLNTMRGRVLVKNVEISPNYSNLVIPSSISHIEFINSKIGCSLTASESKSTSISGLVGYGYNNGSEFVYPTLRNFGQVEHCTGMLGLAYCDNVSHCDVREANNCNNLTDIRSVFLGTGQSLLCNFIFCTNLSNILINNPTGLEVTEFDRCSFISNVRVLNRGGDGVVQYNECTYVDSDTCDNYYSAEEANNIQLITTDGSKKTIPLSNYGEGRSIPTQNAYGQIELSYDEPLLPTEAVPKWYVDDKIGDLSTILTALLEGGIE